MIEWLGLGNEWDGKKKDGKEEVECPTGAALERHEVGWTGGVWLARWLLNGGY